MIIHGFQKLTLLDYPGKTASTVFSGGCNFRCPFCHNKLLVTEIADVPIIPESEFFDYLKTRKGLLEGVCITGGEPLLNRDIADFAAEIKKMGYLVKVDTNGSMPIRLTELLCSGNVDYVAMDVKNCKDKYGITVGIESFDIQPIEKSVDLLKSSGIDFEFRTTVVDEYHTPEDIEKLCEWIKGAENYYIQAFKDSGNIIKEGLHTPSERNMSEMLKIARKYINNAQLRGV